MYHWETEQKDFVVLSGEVLLSVGGEARRLAAVGLRPLPTASSRQSQADGPWGYYTVDEAARRHGACPDEETQDGEAAYARVPPSEPAPYRAGPLPDC